MTYSHLNEMTFQHLAVIALLTGTLLFYPHFHTSDSPL